MVLLCYRLKVIEGVEVLQELPVSPNSSAMAAATSDIPSSESLPQHSHIDFITDVSIVPYKNQQFIVSASYDGVLKLWK